jgi:acyl carrier protein
VILEQVLDIVADVMGATRSELSIKSNADNVPNWDSLHTLNLAVALEGAFGIAFTPEEMADLLSVEIVLATLAEKGVQ